jgi:integrase
MDGKLPTQYEVDKIWVSLMDALGMVRATPEPSEKRKRRYYGLRREVQPIITPHCMRHNYITMCWENGIDVMLVMKIVGHKDAKTTLNIYTHLSRTQLEAAHDKLNGMFSKKVAKKLHNPEIEAT